MLLDGRRTDSSPLSSVSDCWQLVGNANEPTGPVVLDRRTDSTLSSVSVGTLFELAEMLHTSTGGQAAAAPQHNAAVAPQHAATVAPPSAAVCA